MSVTDNLFKTIINGKDGRNIGIPTGLDTIDKYTYGVQRGYLTTVFADSGAGKTTYALFSYVYAPLKFALANNIDISVLYFSFEMSAEALFAKLLSLYIWDTHQKVVSFDEIMSLTSPMSEETFELIVDAKAWLETIERRITVIDKPITPEQISVVLRMWNEKYGKFIDLESGQEDYVPFNRDMYKIVILDHVKLVKNNGKGVKVTIDETCDEFIYFRNKCNITGVFVQQANRQSKSMDRRNGGFQLLQLDDMSDSSGPAQASEIVIGIFHPHREKMNKIDVYNVKVLKDRIRCVQILKQRYGQSDVNKCVNFFGEIGWFRELPEEILDYEPFLNLTDNVKSDKIKSDPISMAPISPNMDFQL